MLGKTAIKKFYIDRMSSMDIKALPSMNLSDLFLLTFQRCKAKLGDQGVTMATMINNRYYFVTQSLIKPAMMAPLYYFDTINNWKTKQLNPFIEDAALQYNRSLIDRMAYLQNALTSIIAEIKPAINQIVLLDAILCVYYGETKGDASLHNSFAKGNSLFTGDSNLKGVTSAFGIGQWLDARLVRFLFFANQYCFNAFGHLNAPLGVLYSPFLQLRYLEWELVNTNALTKVILDYNKYADQKVASGATTYKRYAAELFMIHYQGVERGNESFGFPAKHLSWDAIKGDVNKAAQLSSNKFQSVAYFNDGSDSLKILIS